MNSFVRAIGCLLVATPFVLSAQAKSYVLPVGSVGYESGPALGMAIQGVREIVDTLGTRPTVMIAEYRRSENDGWHAAAAYDRWSAGNDRRLVVHAFASEEPIVFFDSDVRLMPRRRGIDLTQHWRRTQRTWTYLGVGLHESDGDGSYGYFPIGPSPWPPCDTTGPCVVPLHLPTPPGGVTTVIRRPADLSVGISIGSVTREYQALSVRLGSVTDTRDNIFAPSSGRLLDFSFRASHDLSDYPVAERYYSARADLRGYRSLPSGAVLAGQMFAGLDSHELPHFEAAGFGRIGRGFPPGREPGDAVISLEGERRGATRWLRNRLGSVLFGSISGVHYDFGGVDYGFYVALGAGLRYRLDPETRNTLRLDVAYTSERRPVLLLALQEAF